MPKQKEKKLIRKIRKEYLEKGFTMARSNYIANSVVFRNHKKLLYPKYNHPKIKNIKR